MCASLLRKSPPLVKRKCWLGIIKALVSRLALAGRLLLAQFFCIALSLAEHTAAIGLAIKPPFTRKINAFLPVLAKILINKAQAAWPREPCPCFSYGLMGLIARIKQACAESGKAQFQGLGSRSLLAALTAPEATLLGRSPGKLLCEPLRYLPFLICNKKIYFQPLRCLHCGIPSAQILAKWMNIWIHKPAGNGIALFFESQYRHNCAWPTTDMQEQLAGAAFSLHLQKLAPFRAEWQSQLSFRNRAPYRARLHACCSTDKAQARQNTDKQI